MWLILFWLPVVWADLPVHCLHHEILGRWNFMLSPPSPERSSCGHLRPDSVDFQPRRDDVQVGKHLTISLMDPNVAEDEHLQRGTWTMVYDEGFEVEINNLNFFAFSNFSFELAQGGSTKHNISHCDQTMVGWYHNTDRTEFGCYYGSKVMTQEPPAEQAAAVRPVHLGKKPKTLLYQTKLSHHHQRKVIDKLSAKIGNESLGWKAKTMEKWNGLSMLQVNSYAGIKRSRRSTAMLRQHAAKLKTLSGRVKRRSFLQQTSVLQLSKPLPGSWDWTNVSGRNFVEPVMDQSECGSCYVAAAVRLWAAKYGLVGLKELQGKRYRADNHRYVGSWYGEHGDKVEEIKAELYHNGPLILGLEPTEDFMWYSEGIYRSPSSSDLMHSTSSFEWERVDHAVLLVGYGEENGRKYWKLQNSWGEDWGERGFFRMVMGENDSGIESIPEAADVVQDEQDGRQVQSFFQQLQAPTKRASTDELQLTERIEHLLQSKLKVKA